MWSSRFVVSETERKGVVGGKRHLGREGYLEPSALKVKRVVVN